MSNPVGLSYPGIFKFTKILDPWHKDAFVGTPAEGLVLPGTEGPRREVWGAEDAWGDVIATVDGVEGHHPENVNGEWQWVPDKQ